MPELSTVNVLFKQIKPSLSCRLMVGLLMIGLPAFSRTNWKEGFLLFQRLECGSLCAAIQAVTPSYQNIGFNHAAIVSKKGDSLGVVEAIGNRVQWTPLHQFLNRRAGSEPAKVMVGIPAGPWRRAARKAARLAQTYLERPYDVKYLPDSINMYCTEVIYFSFQAVLGDRSPFGLQPMSFKNKSSGKTDFGWEQYYRDLGMEVPEGVPGCNPGQYSLLPELKMVSPNQIK